jgi:ABC-type nitrate/sulfonate/bicarbonate transport system substrate-binding protein
MEWKAMGVTVKELEQAVKEAIEWFEQTEDGSDEAIQRIYGPETVIMLDRWRGLVSWWDQ